MTKKFIFVVIFAIGIIFLLVKYDASALIVPPPPPPAPVGIPVEVNYDNDFYINEYIYKPLARILISKISNSLQNSLLNKIGDTISDQSGGGKDPHFVTDWRNLILNSQGRGSDLFRSILASSDLCPYFSNNLKNIFGADLFGGVLKNLSGNILTNAPGEPSFQYLTKCSLSKDTNVDAFRNDFTQGGWKAWLELQKPENNFTSVLGQAIVEKDNQTALAQKATEDQAIADQGALPNLLDSSGKTSASGCASQGLLTRCTIQGKIVTPGSLFKDAAKTRLDHKLASLNLNGDGIDNIEQLILLLAEGLLNKVGGQLDNLLSNPKF